MRETVEILQATEAAYDR